MRAIKIGLIGESHPGWERILLQEGVPFSGVLSPPGADEFSAVIAASTTDEAKVGWLRSYLAGGGSVLCPAHIFGRLAGVGPREVFINYMLEDTEKAFGRAGLVDIGLECLVAHNANAVKTEGGKPSVFAGEYGGGTVVVLPFDAGDMVLDGRTSTKSFYSGHGRLPFEHVSRVGKGGILKLVSRSLEFLHHRRLIPYGHLWYFPSGSPGVFSWRVDTDGAGPDEISDLYKLTAECSIPASWFLDVKSQQDFIHIFRQMEGHEIGIHCYEHRKYADYDSCLSDVMKAMEVFKRAGLLTSGFAAPYGCWNEEIGRAIEGCGFEYSSEFSYDYDNVPSYPYLKKKISRTLQLPVHPVSIGSLRRQGFDDDSMAEYFEVLIDRKLLSREPVLLYHHPKNGGAGVMRHIFNHIGERKLKILRMIDYARWWKKRNACRIDLAIEGEVLKVSGQNLQDDVWIHVTRPDGSETLVNGSLASVDLRQLNWSDVAWPLPLPTDIRRIRTFNPWIPIKRFEDFIFKKFFRKRDMNRYRI